jgi:tetratricopeptide (TPR) repeat protein
LDNIGYHSTLEFKGRKFSIHTGGTGNLNRIQSEVFQEGKYINSKQVDISTRQFEDDKAHDDFLKKLAQDLHQEMLEEINMLFYVQTKIKPLKQYLPHFKLASVFYARSFITEAIENFSLAINLKDDYVPAYVRLGVCYLVSERYKEAATTFAKAIALKSDYPDLYNYYGIALTFVHNYKNAINVLQKVIDKKPDFNEAHFNLGVALFRSTLDESSLQEKVIVPSRVMRYIRALKELDRYKDPEWQDAFLSLEETFQRKEISEILPALQHLQIKLIVRQKINVLIESFYLKFMYGGRELTLSELEIYERRFKYQLEDNKKFADYWNALGILHIIQCRIYFLQAHAEIEKAVSINNQYEDAKHNLQLIKNNKKGFLILLRAIMK